MNKRYRKRPSSFENRRMLEVLRRYKIEAEIRDEYDSDLLKNCLVGGGHVYIYPDDKPRACLSPRGIEFLEKLEKIVSPQN